MGEMEAREKRRRRRRTFGLGLGGGGWDFGWKKRNFCSWIRRCCRRLKWRSVKTYANSILRLPLSSLLAILWISAISISYSITIVITNINIYFFILSPNPSFFPTPPSASSTLRTSTAPGRLSSSRHHRGRIILSDLPVRWDLF